ncbi:MAG TPA: RecX family transcriptional regulator, partial [Candidatus Paenibacillus intestinavium]|nr:RecX family transcriptional regulator [Candidatus Paenibacillus intestinavium]
SHALERLQKDGYVNDEQYAIAYVQSKTRIQGNGRVKIAHDLKNRGISQSAIQMALTELDEEEEIEAACRVAVKKLRSLSGEEREVRRKLQLFLLRKGYTSTLIRKVMNLVEIEQKSNSEE